MADAQSPDPAAASDAAPPPAVRPVRKYALTAAAVVGGVAMGTFALAPAIAPAAGGNPSGTADAAHGSAAKGGAETTEILQPHLIENLVLNPAGSRGTRFLLLSVGIIMTDPIADDEVRRRDAEVRDRVVQVLGAKTVEDLVDITQRDAFRRELAASLDSLVGRGKIRSVLFPQFVIQ